MASTTSRNGVGGASGKSNRTVASAPVARISLFGARPTPSTSISVTTPASSPSSSTPLEKVPLSEDGLVMPIKKQSQPSRSNVHINGRAAHEVFTQRPISPNDGRHHNSVRSNNSNGNGNGIVGNDELAHHRQSVTNMKRYLQTLASTERVTRILPHQLHSITHTQEVNNDASTSPDSLSRSIIIEGDQEKLGRLLRELNEHRRYMASHTASNHVSSLPPSSTVIHRAGTSHEVSSSSTSSSVVASPPLPSTRPPPLPVSQQSSSSIATTQSISSSPRQAVFMHPDDHTSDIVANSNGKRSDENRDEHNNSNANEIAALMLRVTSLESDMKQLHVAMGDIITRQHNDSEYHQSVLWNEVKSLRRDLTEQSQRYHEAFASTDALIVATQEVVARAEAALNKPSAPYHHYHSSHIPTSHATSTSLSSDFPFISSFIHPRRTPVFPSSTSSISSSASSLVTSISIMDNKTSIPIELQHQQQQQQQSNVSSAPASNSRLYAITPSPPKAPHNNDGSHTVVSSMSQSSAPSSSSRDARPNGSSSPMARLRAVLFEPDTPTHSDDDSDGTHKNNKLLGNSNDGKREDHQNNNNVDNGIMNDDAPPAGPHRRTASLVPMSPSVPLTIVGYTPLSSPHMPSATTSEGVRSSTLPLSSPMPPPTPLTPTTAQSLLPPPLSQTSLPILPNVNGDISKTMMMPSVPPPSIPQRSSSSSPSEAPLPPPPDEDPVSLSPQSHIRSTPLQQQLLHVHNDDNDNNNDGHDYELSLSPTTSSAPPLPSHPHPDPPVFTSSVPSTALHVPATRSATTSPLRIGSPADNMKATNAQLNAAIDSTNDEKTNDNDAMLKFDLCKLIGRIMPRLHHTFSNRVCCIDME
jgi:hypothetical protein